MAVSSSSTTSDTEILKRIADGDAEALASWFRCHKDPLYSFVFFRVSNDPELAADVTQETFTTALQRLNQFDAERGNMINWLRYLSRNIIRSTLGTHRRGAQLQAVWDRIDESLRDAYERIDRELLPDSVLEREETRELVQMTLANLAPHYQEVLQAKYVENHTLETIANGRETTVDSVKSMLRRARMAFRECFLAMAKLEMSDV